MEKSYVEILIDFAMRFFPSVSTFSFLFRAPTPFCSAKRDGGTKLIRLIVFLLPVLTPAARCQNGSSFMDVVTPGQTY